MSSTNNNNMSKRISFDNASSVIVHEEHVHEQHEQLNMRVCVVLY